MDYISEEISNIEQALIAQVSNQLEDLECVDTHELGEVVDMIKDIAEYKRNIHEACYYKSVTSAMDEYDGRRGYIPMTEEDEANLEDLMPDYKRRNRYHSAMNDNDDYGRYYTEYKNAKRHYNESHSMADKDEMNAHAKEHVESMIHSMRDIWSEADPDLRKRMKEDMSKLLDDMN